MVQGTGHAQNFLSRLRGNEAVQLTLDFKVPGESRATALRTVRELATGFGPSLGSKLLMRLGVPMVAATTPAVIRMLDNGWEDDIAANLLVGSGLGGAWGALVGAALPRNGLGVRVSRVRSIGGGAASGILMAPAIALVSKYVADLATSPLQRQRQDEADRRDADTP